jgi:gamma-glutamylcyclotransferase (GGCT)/AIG2-like uncharacterized protein YtfP
MVSTEICWFKKTMSKLNAKFPGLLKVFVYGTLKPGEVNYLKYCSGKVLNQERAVTQGQLFALPMGYPAMTLGNSPVHGYLLSFTDFQVLSKLDELEGYQPTRQISQNLYNRQEIDIFNLQGQPLGLAWVYLMAKERVCQLGGIHQTNGSWSDSEL